MPATELKELKEQAAKVPSLEERQRLLAGFMGMGGHKKPMKRRPKRIPTPQEKAEHAKKKKAVRVAQREARRMNRKRRK